MGTCQLVRDFEFQFLSDHQEMAIFPACCHEDHSLFCLYVCCMFVVTTAIVFVEQKHWESNVSHLYLRDFKNHSKKLNTEGHFCCGISQLFDYCHQMLFPVTSTLGWTWPQPLGLPSLPGWGTVGPRPCWQGSGVPLGSRLPRPPGAAGPCSTLMEGFGLCCCLAFTLPPFLAHKRGSFTQGKFLHSAFQIFFAYLLLLNEAKWQLSILCESILILLLWLDPWMEKEKYFSLSVSCKRKGCLHTLSWLCPCAKATQNQVLF